MNKLPYYLAIFILTLVCVLIAASLKLAIDYAIIIAVFAFLVLLAVKNNQVCYGRRITTKNWSNDQ